MVSPALQASYRTSFKYARRPQHTEMQQPFYIHEKMHGVYSNERNIAKARRGLPYITPLYKKHMNLWETDTDATTNRFFRSYVFGQRELHQLLGRAHGFEADEAGGKQSSSAYELQTDQRFKGIATPMIRNLHFEPEWNYTLYAHHQQRQQTSPSCASSSALVSARPPTEEEVLGRALAREECRVIKDKEHVKAWFDRLQYLIQLHYEAVGDIGEFKSRHTQHVHAFFVHFHDAISSFDFQDTYLLNEFKAVRPKELEDLFAIFLEMEGNYIHFDYCPRCSLPLATTRFCGEGDETTPFRRHRGRWAPHQTWGKEWLDVVVRRAEALWYRSTEDPYFGTTQHTQRQVEAMLTVYVKAKQRSKAVDFVHALRGSVEFLTGVITLTPEMEKQLGELLDNTPHPHLLTNSYRMESGVSRYTGEVQKVPLSPLQVLLDMKRNLFRRQQREEGVVRIPPKSWRLNTAAVVPYRLDPNTQSIANWREVKAGIETAFLDNGLPKEAYTADEWREVVYWKTFVHTRKEQRSALEEERSREVAEAVRVLGEANTLQFPTAHWYQVFDRSSRAMEPFRIRSINKSAAKEGGDAAGGVPLRAGSVVVLRHKVFENPKAVSCRVPGANSTPLLLDTTAEGSQMYGSFLVGEVVRLKTGEEVVVLGVDKSGPAAEWALMAAHQQKKPGSGGVVTLGRNCEEVYQQIDSANGGRTGRLAPTPLLDASREFEEESLGQVVGVRRGVLYVQWRLLRGGGSRMDRSVAVPIGTPQMVQAHYAMVRVVHHEEALQEPPSWWVPFRNDHADERLKEALEAPFRREKWASLIPGKYTPKVKPFGYTQHVTQDDFMTKEYRDRLLSRQFFHRPQMFEIIPERQEKSVSFSGKWEYQRVCGFPSVDRTELEGGWSEVDVMSDGEMEVVEQAIRDISGDRPGNYMKRPEETQSLHLNESWWTPLKHGWDYHNQRQRALHHRLEQNIVDSNKLPFQGSIPAFGTSYGMGERIRSIVEDYSKGFGLGPDGHSVGADHHGFTSHTQRQEDERVARLGYGNALVRLFDEKLAAAGSNDVHQWALQQSTAMGGLNVKNLLLSLSEWREKGAPPSHLLQRVLAQYLEAELKWFNEGLPKGVPRLVVGEAKEGENQGGQIWAEVDRTAYACEHAKQQSTQSQGISGVSYVVNMVQQACCGEASVEGGVEERARQALLESVAADFQMALVRVANKGISPSLLAQESPKLSKGAFSRPAVPFILWSELEKVLVSFQVSTENINRVYRGLKGSQENGIVAVSEDEQHPQKSGNGRGGDMTVPISLVMTWGGAEGAASRGQFSVTSSSRQQRQAAPEEKMVVHILKEMSLYHDGFVADFTYAMEKNRVNPVLRKEFVQALLPVLDDSKAVIQRFEAYVRGQWVPNVTLMIKAFVAFLESYARRGNAARAAASVDYFERITEEDPKKAAEDGVVRRSVTLQTSEGPVKYVYPPRIRLLPPSIGAFQFESTLYEAMETVRIFETYGISTGPTSVESLYFVAEGQAIENYITNREVDFVQVTIENDHGLRNAVSQSKYKKDIESCSLLAPMLSSVSKATLVLNFNRFCYRVLPLLKDYHQLVTKDYPNTIAEKRLEASTTSRQLSRIVEAEKASNVEQEFRRNSERYWRNVLEGRSGVDEMMSTGGWSGRGVGGRSNAANNQRQRTPSRGNNNQQQRATSSSSFPSSSAKSGNPLLQSRAGGGRRGTSASGSRNVGTGNKTQTSATRALTQDLVSGLVKRKK